ncbi:MAG: hypothetical protein ACREBM_03925, partial [Sphingomicrobium sp.]
MRRSRFARAVEIPEGSECASVADAVWLDLRATETPEESSLAAWRVASLQQAPLFLGASHLLIGLTCLWLDPELTTVASIHNPLIPLALVLMLDFGAALAMHWRNRAEVEPSTIVRCLCLYLAASGIVWAMFGRCLAMHGVTGAESLATAAMFGGVAATAVAAIASPPLALVNALVATATGVMFARSPLITAGVCLLSMMMIAYSIV